MLVVFKKGKINSPIHLHPYPHKIYLLTKYSIYKKRQCQRFSLHTPVQTEVIFYFRKVSLSKIPWWGPCPCGFAGIF